MRAPLTDRERGSATVEFVLVLTTVLFTVLTAVQVALVHLAHRALVAAADEGARAARAEQGSAHAGRTQALSYLGQIGPGLVRQPQAAASRTATTARVTLVGYPVEILPGFTIRITATAVSPVERPA